MNFKSIFPYTGQVIAEYPLMDDNDISHCVANAEKAFVIWKEYNFKQRASVFTKIAAILKRDKEILAAVITNEMGKTINESNAEIEKCAYVCEYYAEHAEEFLRDELHEAGYYKSFVSYEPIGAVLGIMPWNFPFWQVFRYAAPTLMAGNVTLLKHAPNVCGCAKKIEEIFIEAGAPIGVFQSLIIDTPVVEKLLQQNIVQAVTLTGSDRAGSAVASLAGKSIKKSVMELGGSDALIVLPDADMKEAAKIALQSRMQNAGQSCIGAKRFIVIENAMSDFMNEINTLIRNIKQGNPLDENINMGPMARIDLVENLQRQMQQSIQSGAQLQFGGEINGCNFSPSILFNVQTGMAAFDQEIFGPLAAVISAKDETDAIALANDSPYGLGASIWTKDLDKGIVLARKIESGAVFINSLVKSDPRIPFGGIKRSGYGRELGRHGILEFVNAKTIALSL
ncbi:MAG: NAD-dependent succinate-semialdehyde dehydrogenase [Bacteroidota bacterium]